MKIVIVEPDGQGGLFHVAFQLCRALGTLGHHVTLVTATDPEFAQTSGVFELAPMMRLWSRTEVANSGRRRSSARRLLRGIRRLHRGLLLTIAWLRVVRRVDRMNPDVVIVSMILHRHIFWIAMRLRRKGRILAQLCHEVVDPEQRGKGGQANGTHPAQQLDRVFFLSRSVQASFLERVDFPETKTSVVPHPRPETFNSSPISQAELCNRLGLDMDRPVLLFFGVLRPSKGIDDLVEAFAVSRSRDAAQLLIAGRATKFMDMARLYAKIETLGLSSQVLVENRYMDADEVQPLFELARAVVLPYRTAAASGVLHRAYACARPPIVTAVGGLAEDVRDGETGLIAPPGDRKELARLMDVLVGDADLADRLGKAGNVFSRENFGWGTVAKRIADTLQSDIEVVSSTLERES